jgi:hypothetical protein
MIIHTEIFISLLNDAVIIVNNELGRKCPEAILLEPTCPVYGKSD